MTRRNTLPAVEAVTVYRATDGSEHPTHSAARTRNRVLRDLVLMREALVDMMAGPLDRRTDSDLDAILERIATRFRITAVSSGGSDDAHIEDVAAREAAK